MQTLQRPLGDVYVLFFVLLQIQLVMCHMPYRRDSDPDHGMATPTQMGTSTGMGVGGAGVPMQVTAMTLEAVDLMPEYS